jgi:hypothetical protein
MRFNSKVWIHKEHYVLVKELTKSQVSLNHFLTHVIKKPNLELLTITNGNTNFPRFITQSGSSRVTSNHLGAKRQE